MRFIFKIIILFLLGILVHCGEAQAQKIDSTKSEAPKNKYKNPRPRNAALMSMVLPGLGQAYNKKYWKTPLVWAGLIIDGYFLLDNHYQRNKYRTAYQTHEDTMRGKPEFYQKDRASIKLQWDYSERNFDLNMIIAGGLYGLNILDAYVDAHLKEFDVKEDLAIRIKPSIKMGYNNTVTTGISVTFKFK